MAGMSQTLVSGTAGLLGGLLKNKGPYFYYGKTGTTGDDEKKTKSKLFGLLISKEDVTNPNHTFRNNRFYSVYFLSQNGPAKQNEVFQARIVRLLETSPFFQKYMNTGK